MKVVRLNPDNTVAEIIPEYALPVEHWYGADFAASCVTAPEEVQERWRYDPGTGIFSGPEQAPDPVPENDTDTEVLNALLGVLT